MCYETKYYEYFCFLMNTNFFLLVEGSSYYKFSKIYVIHDDLQIQFSFALNYNIRISTITLNQCKNIKNIYKFYKIFIFN